MAGRFVQPKAATVTDRDGEEKVSTETNMSVAMQFGMGSAPAPGASNRRPRWLALRRSESRDCWTFFARQNVAGEAPATAPEAGALPLNCIDAAQTSEGYG